MTSAPAPVSAAAKQQHQHDDDQDHFHSESPLMVFEGGGVIRRALNPSIRRPCLEGCRRFVGAGGSNFLSPKIFPPAAPFTLPLACSAEPFRSLCLPACALP
jgi:hypothetical protein